MHCRWCLDGLDDLLTTKEHIMSNVKDLSTKALKAKANSLKSIIANAEPAKRRTSKIKAPWVNEEIAILHAVREAVVNGAKMTELLRQVHAAGHLPQRGLAEAFVKYRELYSAGSKLYKGDKPA